MVKQAGRRPARTAVDCETRRSETLPSGCRPGGERPSRSTCNVKVNDGVNVQRRRQPQRASQRQGQRAPALTWSSTLTPTLTLTATLYVDPIVDFDAEVDGLYAARTGSPRESRRNPQAA